MSFWDWMLEWGFPLLVMFAILRLDSWRKERLKKRREAQEQLAYEEMRAAYLRRKRDAT